MNVAADTRKPWLFGPVPDLLLGSGLAYCFVFGLLLVAATQVRTLFPPWAMLLAVVFLSMPHYGATLLRVYEKREERRAYVVFTVYSTILLAMAFYWGIHSILVGTVLFTLYLTWSPWHYTGQNYGIALMLLARRGVKLSTSVKKLVYSSFVLSYVVTFFFIHGPTTYVPYKGQQINYLSLNIHSFAADLILFTALLGYAFTMCASLFMLFRQGGHKAIPTAVLMLTQGIWFVVPAVVRNWFPAVSVPILTNAWAGYAFTWIALGHAVQYLWITSYYASASKRAPSNGVFYGKALLIGCALWTIPVLVFAPGFLGKLPYDIGLAATLAATVNLHHFILDGAIWKLRDGRVARILLRRQDEDVLSAPEPSSGTWRGQLVVAAGVLSIVIAVGGILGREFGLSRPFAAHDLDRATLAADRLAWIGQDSASTRQMIGMSALSSGELDRAVVQLEKGVRFYPTTSGWMYLGEARQKRGEFRQAISAYHQSVALDPDNGLAHMLLAHAYVSTGKMGHARSILQEDRRRATAGSLRYERLRQSLIDLLAEDDAQGTIPRVPS